MTEFEKAKDEQKRNAQHDEGFDAGADWAYEWFDRFSEKVDLEMLDTNILLKRQVEQLTKKLAVAKEQFKKIKDAHGLFMRFQDSIYAATINEAASKGLAEIEGE